MYSMHNTQTRSQYLYIYVLPIVLADFTDCAHPKDTAVAELAKMLVISFV